MNVYKSIGVTFEPSRPPRRDSEVAHSLVRAGKVLARGNYKPRWLISTAIDRLKFILLSDYRVIVSRDLSCRYHM